MSELMTCPSCQGAGTQTVLARATGGCLRRLQPCFHCDGTGTRTQADLDREAAGSQLRALRASLLMSQRQVAKHLGCNPAQVNDLEWGRRTTLDAIMQAHVALSTIGLEVREEHP